VTAAKRPNLNRKVTPKSEANRQAELDQGVRLTVDGETYEVRIGDVTANIGRELRRQTGHGFTWLMDAITREPDVDLIADFVWLARRIRGEHVDIEDVAFDYGTLLSDDFEVSLPGADQEDDGDPEA
jgi:hypothetical protein